MRGPREAIVVYICRRVAQLPFLRFTPASSLLVVFTSVSSSFICIYFHFLIF
jgi:hypothetical protein